VEAAAPIDLARVERSHRLVLAVIRKVASTPGGFEYDGSDRLEGGPRSGCRWWHLRRPPQARASRH
jgi:hypothetical protein